MAPITDIINKFKNRLSVSGPKHAHAEPTGPVTLSLSKRSPPTASAKIAAAVEDTAATVSEKEPFTIGSAYVSRLRVKYANRFDHFKANTGKTNGLDKRADTAQVAAVSDTGSEPLVDQQDELLWVGQVGVGTPAQIVTVDFDTGSSDLWVNPSIYKPSASSTAKKTGKTFRVAYGDGSNATGDIYLESVTVGGLTAVKQAFGTATKSTLDDSGNQGIAGMAFKSIAQFNADPFFDTLVKQGTAPQNVFAFGLWPEGARLDLGHIATEAYQGEITYSKVDPSDGFWTTSFEVTGTDSTQSGIIDTGTTLIIGPPDVVTALYKSLGVETQVQNGEVYGVYPTSSPPSITLTFNGTPFTISPDALSFQAQGDQTIGGIIGADIGGPAWIIGDTFLQDVYAVFDKGNLQVGFAPKATSFAPASGSTPATGTTDAVAPDTTATEPTATETTATEPAATETAAETPAPTA